MASINKLSIRGVRSFSPDDAEQVVEFYFPCTIIVGANGCGKTTIIESLKFAVCGALPPGNKSGQAFVHDPRSVGQSVVKGNIKLRFTNRAGSSMVVVRSMEVAQKKTTMSFKQLDGVLRTVDKDGNRQSLSHKCSELDRQIPMLLGVSKAILENVVFCHQEDASWPLQEGAVLKKRFDDIFDSSRYSKALEVFAKVKKEYQLKVKDLKADVSGLSSHKHAAKGFQQEITKFTQLVEDVEDQIGQLKQSMDTIDQERTKLRSIIEQVEELENEIESQRNRYTQQQAVVTKQRHMIQEDITQQYTMYKIKDMLRDFDKEMKQQLFKKQELQDQVMNYEGEIAKFRKEQSQLQSRMARLDAEQESHQKRLQSRYDKMVDIGQRYGLADLLTQITQSQPQGLSQATQTTSKTMTQDDNDDNDSSTNDNNQAVQQKQRSSTTVLDFSKDDLESFSRALERKREELKSSLGTFREKCQQQEDQLQSMLTDLIGRQKSIETERSKLNKEQSEARSELQQIASHVSKTSRLRKSDVEEAKRQATKYNKDRDEANNDPRRNEIPTEIRANEEKIDKLKREIEDDQIALRDLRHSAEAQSSIAVLREQCSKDLEALSEHMQEQSYILQRFRINSPSELPGSLGGDENGEELTTAIERIVDSITKKYDSSNLELSKSTEEMTRLQKLVSETSALVSHDHKALAGKKARLNQLDGKDGSISNIRAVVENLRQYEQTMGMMTPTDLDETTPQELYSYLGKRLEEAEAESTEGIQPQIIKKVLNRLKRQSRNRDKFSCPCCTRDLETEQEMDDFVKQMKFLMGDDSPLVKSDERNKTARSSYRMWRKVVEENMNDVLEYRRIVNEANDLEIHIADLEMTLSQKNADLDKAKGDNDDLQTETDELRNLLDVSKRWAEAAGRIAEKRMQVNQKQLDLSMSTADVGGRDLKTVERELGERLEKKDLFANQINRLNKEMSSINNRIAQLSTLATRMEQLARDKVELFEKDQKMAERKIVLNETISKCTEEEKKLQDDIAPLRQRIRTKQAEKQRMRDQAMEEENRLSDAYNTFLSDVANLKEVMEHIDEYDASNKSRDLESLSQKLEAVVGQMNARQAEIDATRPDLDKISKAVEDQERHKKNLKDNIDLINAEEQMKELENEIAKLEEEAAKVEGHETCNDDWEKLAEEKQELLASRARLEGRRGEIVENIRSLKRKLSTPEYKNVDEEHRVAMIKHETTQMAVRDVDKYYSALDKALLRFHSIKIAEINTIIRDLWCLTYKGEDITNIELVSGQDSGSRASRSYNYRVVMTKGIAQMDMRGRCSAGQRVLASIVIRLALAETFCVNCGCIALDEPTVNLDHENKRGLAIALAQIVASRSKQRNFQLILITHDEDFVAMMKTELSSQTGFAMPERYFQVRREEGTDGKYYSKIDAIDWDELV